MSSFACPGCKNPFAPDDVSLATGLARCRRCATVHQVGAPARPRPEADVVARPASITEQNGDGLTLELAWYHASAWVLVLFCVAWNAFLLMWFSIALSEPDAPLILLIFPIGHVAVGVGIAYVALAMFVNRTTIAIRGGRLTASHGPLRWSGGCDLSSGDVSQLFVAEHRGNKGARSWQVMAVAGKSAVTVTARLSEYATARYIERRIESWLQLTDVSVTGEAEE